jgi:hypothetical protein
MSLGQYAVKTFEEKTHARRSKTNLRREILGSRGWPTFTFFVKVGTHAADTGVFIFTSPH